MEFSQPVGFEIVDLAIELERLLEQRVDLVSRGGVHNDLFTYIEKDIVYV